MKRRRKEKKDEKTVRARKNENESRK